MNLPLTNGWGEKHCLFVKWKYVEAKVCPSPSAICILIISRMEIAFLVYWLPYANNGDESRKLVQIIVFPLQLQDEICSLCGKFRSWGDWVFICLRPTLAGTG